MDYRQMALDNMILKVRVGSHLYCTETETSDIDYIGVTIPPKECVLGTRKFEQAEFKTSVDGFDMTIYSLQKFVKLAAGNNPNILEVFFVDSRHRLLAHPLGNLLRNFYQAFVCLKVKHTFCGYAFAQKRKMDQKNPVGKRKEDYDRFEYCRKFASHTVRLLHEGVELLKEGCLVFPPFWKDEVREIKTSDPAIPLEDIKRRIESLETIVEIAYANSTLPKTPDWKVLDNLLISMHESHWDLIESCGVDKKYNYY